MRWFKRKTAVWIAIALVIVAVLLRSYDDQWCTRCCARRAVTRVASVGIGDLGVPICRRYPERPSVVHEVLVRHQGACRWHRWRTYHGNSATAFYGGDAIPTTIDRYNEALRILDRLRSATAQDVILHMHGLLVRSEWVQLNGGLRNVLYSLSYELDIAQTEDERQAIIDQWQPEWNAYLERANQRMQRASSR